MIVNIEKSRDDLDFNNLDLYVIFMYKDKLFVKRDQQYGISLHDNSIVYFNPTTRVKTLEVLEIKVKLL